MSLITSAAAADEDEDEYDDDNVPSQIDCKELSFGELMYMADANVRHYQRSCIQYAFVMVQQEKVSEGDVYLSQFYGHYAAALCNVSLIMATTIKQYPAELHVNLLRIFNAINKLMPDIGPQTILNKYAAFLILCYHKKKRIFEIPEVSLLLENPWLIKKESIVEFIRKGKFFTMLTVEEYMKLLNPESETD
jgi:hypothetical protein